MFSFGLRSWPKNVAFLSSLSEGLSKWLLLVCPFLLCYYKYKKATPIYEILTVTAAYQRGILRTVLIKVIPQKKKFPMNFFETFPECSPPSIVSKKTIKMIGQNSRLKDMRGQSYPIYACSRANPAHYSSVHVKFCSTSKHTLLK